MREVWAGRVCGGITVWASRVYAPCFISLSIFGELFLEIASALKPSIVIIIAYFALVWLN
jgi:hypothetical protein